MLSILGIRHHGPGSTRSMLTALEKLAPDLVLVEGPPDANDLIPLVGDAAMRPPVALLLYEPDQPSHAVYYPFAEFSPEWQALRFALRADIPVRFMDLPQANRLRAAFEKTAEADPASKMTGQDPFALVAQAAGFSDGERWWESFVEQRQDPDSIFEGILALMSALREDQADVRPEAEMDLRREAAMRQIIRQAQSEGFEQIAVVCGAWHAPALADPAALDGDPALLQGLPETALKATWVPWTYDRLARRSGYGAGIDSPGWYHHLWFTQDDLIESWMVRVGRLMRAEDLAVSPAHAIEAARLAEALAALRGRPLPGLPELAEAVRAVYCFDSDAPMRLIREKLIISQRMGWTPKGAADIPLAADLEAIQRRIRFKPSAASKMIDLDLRRPLLLQRSQLLHRLNLLGIPWGVLQGGRRGMGTFHEVWEVAWQPEFAVRLIEAGLWGNTVQEAAENKTRALAAEADALPQLTALVESALLSDLKGVMPILVRRLQRLAATSNDIGHLMDALPPLANVLRYGDVRQTETGRIEGVVSEMVTRICIGLPPACFSLDDDAAQAMVKRIDGVHDTLDILRGTLQDADWLQALEALAGDDRVHGLVRGRVCQLLFAQPEKEDAVALWMSRTLSPGTPPPQAAAWLEGFLTGSGQVLIYHPHLWQMLDEWVMRISDQAFTAHLPLLRRTFSTFTDPEKRKLGEIARAGGQRVSASGGQMAQTHQNRLNQDRVEKALTLVIEILNGKGVTDG